MKICKSTKILSVDLMIWKCVCFCNFCTQKQTQMLLLTAALWTWILFRSQCLMLLPAFSSFTPHAAVHCQSQIEVLLKLILIFITIPESMITSPGCVTETECQLGNHIKSSWMHNIVLHEMELSSVARQSGIYLWNRFTSVKLHLLT